MLGPLDDGAYPVEALGGPMLILLAYASKIVSVAMLALIIGD